MPSPLAHALAGLTVHVATAPAGELASRRRAAVTVGAALAPDLDFAWRLLDGVNHHQAQGHSIGVGLVVAAAVTLVAAAGRAPRPWALGLAALAGWTSHLLLDLLNVDTSPPIGLMALWPFSAGYFKSPWSLFLDIGRTLNWRTVRHDVVAIAWEVAVLCPVLIAAWRGRARRRAGAWHGARVREQISG
ncbi:MAG: hypothetical protein DMF77_23080 [Acidobacteria bacterium]|nr:MAG: hypothetical protein DMF77_23080 [Acidobacteriota bacterium]